MPIAAPLPTRASTPRSFLNGAHQLQPPAGWYADPARTGDARWWDGSAWGAQSQTGRYAERAFHHPETLNEHVHDAIDSLWLAKLDRILRLAKGELVTDLPTPVTARASAPDLTLVPALVPSVVPALTALALALRITGERAGGSTWQAIADRLTADGVPTARGGARWRIPTVQRAGGHRRP